MKLFSIDLKVAATAYVRAENKEQAIAALKAELARSGTDLVEFEISGLSFDNPELPTISLSPAMTVWGPWGDWSDMGEA